MKRFLKPTSYRTSAIVSTTLVLTGCTVLTYRGPNGEQFTRASLGSNTAIGSLAVESAPTACAASKCAATPTTPPRPCPPSPKPPSAPPSRHPSNAALSST